jgi:hypothetical protein
MDPSSEGTIGNGGLRATPIGESVAEDPIELEGDETGELIAVAEEAVGLAGWMGVEPPAAALLPLDAAFLTTCVP